MMVVTGTNVGIDLVSVDRFRRLLDRYGSHFSKHVFTTKEWGIYNRYPSRLAARLAAKEAMGKALGVGLSHMHRDGVPATDIEILNSSTGAPTVALLRTAVAVSIERGFVSFSISLSHNTEYATAVIIGTFRHFS